MSKKVNRVGKLFLRFIATASLLSAPSLASAQCVVGGTNFDTQKALCNPDLSNDADGWFSEDPEVLEAALDGCTYQEDPVNASQTGMPSNTLLSPSGGFESKTWAALKKTNGFLTTAPAGMTAILSNPKLIDPILSAGNGTNMLVTAGTSHDKAYFMAYTVNGLKPGSTATMTMDVYYLLDPESMKAALEAAEETQMSAFGGSVQYQISNTGKGQAQTPSAGIKWSTNLDANGAPASGATETATITATSGPQKVTMKGVANSLGSVTFYVSRTNPNALPIGIDNIEVTGSVQPVITCAKQMPCCPENPVTLALKQTYPAKTTYEWSVAGATGSSTTPSLVFTPKEKDKKYTATCKVTIPGCTPVSATFDVETKECCTMKDASGNVVPMAETNIFYDDFGTFPDNRTYEYTDAKGVKHQVPVDGGLWTNVERPYSTKFQPGSTITGIPYKGNGDITTCITNVNPYTPGVNGDASGTGRGGMLVFDVDKNFTGDLANKVLYEREICGLCKGKEITFSASFGAINNNPAGVGEMAIVLRKGNSKGEDLLEGTGKSGMLYGTEDWKNVEKKFTVQDNSYECVVLQVVNITPSYGTSQGDFAIDDISFTVCTPPDVSVESSLTAEELLDLCTDKPLQLKADISEASKAFYGSNIGYLFQYTYDDPSTTDDDKITWHDLSSGIQANGDYEITTPATHPAFAPLADGGELNVYFRVVIGDAKYLSDERDEWMHMSALSPCRAISISSIPIVAALNCAKCTKPNDIEFVSDVDLIDGASADDPQTVKLCFGESASLKTKNLLPDEADYASKDFKGFLVEWLNDGKVQTALTGTPLGTAKENVVEYDDTKTPGSKETWTVRVSDPDFPESPNCIKEKDIIVEYLKRPEIEDVPLEYCYGAPEVDDVLPTAKAGEVIKYYETEAAALDGTTDVPAPALATLEAKDEPYEYYYTLTNADGCVSLPAKVIITVNAIPEYTVEDIDPFCAKQSEIDALPIADDAAKYSIAWTPAATAAGLNTLEGSKTPYALTYVVTDAATGCVAKAQDYSVTVMPATIVKLTADSTCGKTTVSTLITPTGASLLYFIRTPIDTLAYLINDALAEEKTVFNPDDDVTELKVVAQAKGYCYSADSIAVTVQKIPGNVTTADPSCYLKSQEATFTNVQKHCAANGVVAALFDETDANNKGAGLEWRIAGTTDWSSTIPTPTVKNPKDPAEETIDYEVRLKNAATGCFGETAEFTAHIYGAPVPNVTNAEYCQNATADPLSSRVTINNTIAGTYTLKVYTDKGKTSPVDMETAPSTATPGVVTYYATQTGVGGESDPVAFTVTTYGVDIPTVAKTDFMLCRDRDLAELSAELNVNPAKYMMGTTLLWSEERGEFKEEKPVVSNAKAGEFMYSVKQVYNIITEGFVATCEGEAVSIHVTVDETDAPTGTMSVLYLYNDLETKGSFDNLLDQDATVVTIEDGYKYEYAVADAAGNVTGAWSTTVPTPAAVDRSELVDEPKVVYYKVRRTKTTGGQCPSEEKLITVTITDSPTPAVTPAYFCEGETIPSLDAYAKTTGTTKIPATGYTLLWYGSEKPAATDMES
ncbi:MAG: hypothetical protein MJZ02_05655, partial [Paludibacteraceae bacterium]|nr:hypothetical protein [Paludibacteraceae bacterium]